MVKIYVAGKFEDYRDVASIMSQLETAGHTITYDWTPHAEDEATGGKPDGKRSAVFDMAGVTACDVLIVRPHARGKGLYAEVGAAIALKKVVLVLPPLVPSEISFVFFEHPQCYRVKDVDDALDFIEVLTA